MLLLNKQEIFFLFLAIVLTVVILSACSPSQPSPTPTTTEELVATSTPAPTSTNTPKPTYTLSGTGFFDYNGNGLQDVAYDMNGEEVEEPAIPYVPVCLDHDPYQNGIDDNNCTYSNEDGSYTFTDLKNGSHTLYVVSPSNEPAEAFRYVNIWKREVTIEEYTKDIDNTTMDSLEAIEACEADSGALVCKLDEDTLLVREQHLNDTEVKPIEDRIDIRISGDSEKDIALMQGWLRSDRNYPIYVSFDLDPRYIYSRNYAGKTSNPPNAPNSIGFDGHTGLDFSCAIGDLVLSFAPGKTIFIGDNGRGALIYEIVNVDNFTTHYGHLSVILTNSEIIYRDQIIGLCGITGGATWPHIHFQFGNPQGQPTDPFQDTQDIDGTLNYWISYNNPYSN